MTAFRKALVIGASALVGGALMRVLERNGVEVVAADSRPAEGALALDVQDAAAVGQCVAAAAPDVVFLAVNLPGGVDRREEQPDAADARANPSWFGFPITVREGVSRAALAQHLETANIETRQVFGGNILKQSGYRDIPRRVHGTLTETDRIMRDTFFVGVYPGLTAEMVDFIPRRVGEFWR